MKKTTLTTNIKVLVSRFIRIGFGLVFSAALLLLPMVAFDAVGGTGTLNDYNPYNVNIPDNGGSVNSDLRLSGAPTDSAITKVKIYYEIRHTYIGDLKVWLTAYYDGAWHDFVLKNREGGSAHNIIETRDNLTTWNGASPNQTWYLVAQDMATGDIGFIDFFELWVTYSYNVAPKIPTNETPVDGAKNVSTKANLNWSCSDPDGDTLYYTVYFEKNNSSPNAIIKNNATGSYAAPGTLDYSSHYFWRVKADDHKGGIAWSPVWDFYTESAPVINAKITSVSFDKTQVKRGLQTISATIKIQNTGNRSSTFYVCGSSQSPGSEWYDWVPWPASITLAAGASGNVVLSWSPASGVQLGAYGFYSKVTRDSDGSTVLNDNWRTSAFSVTDPIISAEISNVSFNRAQIKRGVQSVTGNVTVKNIGDLTRTFYVWGSSRSPSAAWSDWTPWPSPINLAPGASAVVSLSWSPPSNAELGSCAFYSKVTRDSGGTITLEENWKNPAFSVIEPAISATITSVAFDRTTLARGIDVIKATVSVKNTGDVQTNFYVGGSCIRSGGAAWYEWTPDRTEVTIDAGATASIPITWLPPSQADTGSYGFYSKVFRSPSGTDFYDENWRDAILQVSAPQSFASVSAHEIIVRAGSSLDLGNSTEVQALIGHCLAAGVPAISLMVKHDETGELLYPSSLPYTARYKNYPASYIANLINTAHQNGLKVYAWLPMFNDKVLYNARSDYRMHYRHDTSAVTSPTQDWVSPANSGVTGHRLSIVQETLSQFAFDGIRIDHSRFNSDWEDMSSTARTAFLFQFGVDPVNLTGRVDPNWVNWVDWRADLISAFNESVRNQARSCVPAASVGAYIFTDSASPGGYHDRTWSGQRYEDYGILGRNLEINTMPMVYWQDWSAGNVTGYIEPALRYGRQLSTPTELIPVFSVTEGTRWAGILTEDQVRQYMSLCGRLCRSNGVRKVSYFYYSTWRANHFDRIRASYQGPVGAVTPGHQNFGTVTVGQSAQRVFTLQNVGTESLTIIPSCNSPFSVVSPTGSVVLAPGQSSQVTIAYSPTAQGTATQKVRFQTTEGTIKRSVSGTGTPPNNPPTDIVLSGASVPENQPPGTTVGTLSTIDPDADDTFTYTLVSGTGSGDNSSFKVIGNRLQTAVSFNYEARNRYSIRIRVTDQGGLWYEKAFMIFVSDVAEPPITPNNISPTNGATNQPLKLTLQASPFSDPDTGDNHTASQWIIRRLSDDVTVLDSGEDNANKTSRTVADGLLANSATYGWQVRYKDNHGLWSGYSPQTTFTTIAPDLTALRAGTNLVLSWPTSALGFSLVYMNNLNTTNWTLVSPLPVIVNGQNTVTNPIGSGSKYYQLMR